MGRTGRTPTFSGTPRCPRRWATARSPVRGAGAAAAAAFVLVRCLHSYNLGTPQGYLRVHQGDSADEAVGAAVIVTAPEARARSKAQSEGVALVRRVVFSGKKALLPVIAQRKGERSKGKNERTEASVRPRPQGVTITTTTTTYLGVLEQLQTDLERGLASVDGAALRGNGCAVGLANGRGDAEKAA